MSEKVPALILSSTWRSALEGRTRSYGIGRYTAARQPAKIAHPMPIQYKLVSNQSATPPGPASDRSTDISTLTVSPAVDRVAAGSATNPRSPHLNTGAVGIATRPAISGPNPSNPGTVAQYQLVAAGHQPVDTSATRAPDTVHQIHHTGPTQAVGRHDRAGTAPHYVPSSHGKKRIRTG